MLPRLRFFLKQALWALFRSLGVTTLAVVTIGVALAVLATFVVIVDNLARVSRQLGRDVEISVYLEPTVTSTTGMEVAGQLVARPVVSASRFLTSREAMDEFSKSLGEDAVILEGLPADVLPPSVEIILIPRAWTASEVSMLAADISRDPRVTDVRYGQEDIEKVNALLSFARLATMVLGIALCLGTILIVSNTIRLTVYARRDEIEIMSLVGATGAFVRAPFVMEGAIQGLLGGLVAALTLIGLEEALRVAIERGLSYAYEGIEFSFVPGQYIGALFAAGCALGLLGSLLAVGKFLKV